MSSLEHYNTRWMNSRVKQIIDNILNIYNFTAFSVIFITLIASCLRLAHFDYPISNQEVHIQHLASSHILQHKTFLTVGHFNGTLPGIGMPPVYNYILSAMQLVGSSVTNVQFLNLILQISALLAGAYALSIFSSRLTGMLWLLLTSVSFPFVNLSQWMWPPHLMFVLLSFAMASFAYAYEMKRTRYIYIGVFFYCVSTAVTMSPLVLAPCILAFTASILRSIQNKAHAFMRISLFATCALLFLYAPLIFSHLSDTTGRSVIPTHLSINLFQTLRSNLQIILYDIFPGIAMIPVELGLITATVVTLLVSRTTKPTSKESVMLKQLILLTVSYILVASLSPQPLLSQHFIPLYGFLTAGIALLLTLSIRKSRTFGMIFFACVMAMIIADGRLIPKNKPLEKYHEHKQLTNSIVDEVKRLNSLYRFDSYTFFRFHLVMSDSANSLPDDEWFFDTLFWPYLENIFNTKMTEIIQRPTHYTYRPANSDDVIIVGCSGLADEKDARILCLNPFLETNDDYHLSSNFYHNHGYSFYSTKRNDSASR